MRGKVWAKRMVGAAALASALLALGSPVWGQGAEQTGNQEVDLTTVGALLQKLQIQVQELHAQVSDLKAQQQSTKAESEAMRRELDQTKSQLLAMSVAPGNGPSAPAVSPASGKSSTAEERLSRLEENQQLADSKIAEQSQTKVESGSKYRLRFTGIVLLNMLKIEAPLITRTSPCLP